VTGLPCFEYRTTVVIELYRVRCQDCEIEAQRVVLLPTKAPFSKRFEEAVGKPVRAPRYEEWPGSLAWRQVQCGRSICGRVLRFQSGS
jgi:hypothetical protein